MTRTVQFYSPVYGTGGYDQTAANAAFHSVPYQEPGAAVWPQLWCNSELHHKRLQTVLRTMQLFNHFVSMTGHARQ